MSPIHTRLPRISRCRPFVCASIVLLLASLCLPAGAQQTTLRRYDVYTGFVDLYSPALGLNQKGFHAQVGRNMNRWLVWGGDYSVSSGSNVLKPDLLPVALQQQLGEQILALIQAGVIPPTYQLAIPTSIVTQSFAAGPQFSWRHFSRVTLFVRPSLGAFRLAATPHPGDPVATGIAQSLVPSGHKVDWTGFYGFGGGDEVQITPLVGIRTQFDEVYNHPFNDILANGFWTTRFSAGLNFHIGHNILASAKPATRPGS
jgi:hypothetical protein